ncbi:MAG: DUF4912 domain-containing protein [Planctomycetaceae bacterium]|jgi:hypothetical protein|nr:DUF4912 domain-containing protein [Planctomycetaceae bacterium]
MATSAELNIFTAKQLGSIAKTLSISGWHEMRKDEVIRSIIAKSRTKSGGEQLKQILNSSKPAEFNLNKSTQSKPSSAKPSSSKPSQVKSNLTKSDAAKTNSVKSSLTKTNSDKSNLNKPNPNPNKPNPNNKTNPVKPNLAKPASAVTTAIAAAPKTKPSDKAKLKEKEKEKEVPVLISSTPSISAAAVLDGKRRLPKSPDAKLDKTSALLRDRRKEAPRKLASSDTDLIRTDSSAALVSERSRLSRDLGSSDTLIKEDQLALTVRGPFWLHAFWQLSSRTIERIKVTMGHYWFTAMPVLRIYRVESEASLERRRLFREIRVHGGVRHWYIDVTDPPSVYQAELGYLSREKKFHLLVSSNTVETPPRQIVDDLDKLDDNWREIDENLARIYKLSSNDANNADLKRVLEKHLNRPMSQPLISRYRSSHQKSISEKTKRNFDFNVDVDIIIHGKTDPSVQVTVKNEPITINSDGTFSVRFSIPEKRHVFPIEAEGSDGVEVQRVILTMERNTRILETLFQEPADDD